MYWRVAGSDAVAATMIVYSSAPCSSSDVDAEEVLPLLVDDRVEQDRRLAGLPVADDQLALAAADGDHRVDRLDAGLDRRVDRLPGDDAGGNTLDGRGLLGLDGTLRVERRAERADHPAEQLGADRHLDDAPGGLDLVALLEVLVGAHDHGPDLVLLEVERHAVDVARELQKLAGHGAAEAVDLGDPVADRDDPPDFGRDQLGLEVLEPGLDYVGDVLRTDAQLLTSLSIVTGRGPCAGAGRGVPRRWRR